MAGRVELATAGGPESTTMVCTLVVVPPPPLLPPPPPPPARPSPPPQPATHSTPIKAANKFARTLASPTGYRQQRSSAAAATERTRCRRRPACGHSYGPQNRFPEC